MLLENPKASVPKAVPSLFRKQSYFWSTFRTATFLHFLELRLDMGHSLGNRNILLLFAGKFPIREDLLAERQQKQGTIGDREQYDMFYSELFFSAFPWESENYLLCDGKENDI